MSDAEDKVKSANIRAVRGAAVNEILTGTKRSEYLDKAGDYYVEEDKCWYATATVTANGDMKDLEIAKECPDGLDKESGTCEKDEDGNYSVAVKISEAVDLKAAGAGVGP